MGSSEGLLAWTLAFGALQLARSLAFLLGQRRRPPPLRGRPSVALIVPCGGDPPNLPGAARALLGQDYPGRWEVVFAAGPADAYARAVLAPLCAASAGRARLVSAEREPERSSAKAVNLLAGLSAASADSEVLAFADGDQTVGPGWLSGLAAELEDGARVATSVALPAAGLELAWTLYGLPYLERFGVVCGQSFALRREDFEALGAAALWTRTVSEDLSLSRAARDAGLRVRLSMRLAPASANGRAGRLARIARWMTLFRVHDKRVWLSALAAVAAKLWFLFEALFMHRTVCWDVLAALLGADALNLAALAWGLGRSPALGLAAPALLALQAAGAAASLGPRRVRWGAHVYRLRGPLDASAARVP